MILLFSSQSDECASQVYSCLREMGREVMLVDDSLQTDELRMAWYAGERNERSFLEIRGQKVFIEDIEAIFLRFLNPLRPMKGQAIYDQSYVLYELSATLIGLLSEIDCPVLNRPDPANTGRRLYLRRNGGELVRDAGLETPTTFVGSTQTACLEFVRRHANDSFVLTGLGLGVEAAFGDSGEIEAAIHRIYTESAVTPAFIQLVPDGEMFEVFVVGKKCFPISRGSSRAALGNTVGELRPAALSAAAEQGVLRLVSDLGLGFAQVNVLRHGDNRWSCYEVNEFPALGSCKAEVQREISMAIADHLTAVEEIFA